MPAKIIPTKKPASAADFRKADIASVEAFNKRSLTTPTPIPTGTGGLSGTGMNDLFELAKKLGWGNGGGGGGMSAADRAQIDLERRKLRSANRQFNQEMGLKRKQFATEQQRLNDELTRRQGGLDAYIAALTGQIAKGPDTSALTDTLSKLAASARGTVGSAYDAMTAALGNITNPFAGYQAQAVSSPTAGLEQFLASQGTGADDLTRFAELQRTQSQQQAQAANNLMAQLGGLFTGAQQSRLAEAAQGKTADLGTIGLNEMLAGLNIQQQGKTEMDKLRDMLLQAQLQRAGL